MASLQLILPLEFGDSKHNIDNVAQKYLEKASKSVQHLVPIETLADGNCLFSSTISLMPDCDISAVGLRGLSRSLCVHRKVSMINVSI